MAEIPLQANEDGVQIAGETANVCPICQTMLSDGIIQNRAVHYCTRCRGFLIPVTNFLPLVEFLRALHRPTGSNIQPRDNSDADRNFACPICGKTMTAHPYGGPGNVNIDTCESCSVIWRDHDELQRIVMAPDYSSLYSR